MNFYFRSEEQTEEMNDIVRCLNVLCSVPEGSMPLARKFGLSWRMLSEIPLEMENDFATEIVSKALQFEPRVRVMQTDFQHDSEHGESNVFITIEREKDGTY